MVVLKRQKARDTSEGPAFNPTKVDFVSLSPDNRLVRLHIVVDAPWTGSHTQLMSLPAHDSTRPTLRRSNHIAGGEESWGWRRWKLRRINRQCGLGNWERRR